MEEEILCEYCCKFVPSISLQMHQVHCERFHTKCNLCGVRLHKNDLESHMAHEHALTVCTKCGLEFEIRFLDAHPCRGEEIVCEFCEGHFPKSFFDEHVKICMNRTETCPRCFNYIKLVDYKKHVNDGNCEDYYEKKKRLEMEEKERKRKEEEQKIKPEIRPYLEDRKMMSRKKREELEIKKAKLLNL